MINKAKILMIMKIVMIYKLISQDKSLKETEDGM